MSKIKWTVERLKQRIEVCGSEADISFVCEWESLVESAKSVCALQRGARISVWLDPDMTKSKNILAISSDFNISVGSALQDWFYGMVGLREVVE